MKENISVPEIQESDPREELTPVPVEPLSILYSPILAEVAAMQPAEPLPNIPLDPLKVTCPAMPIRVDETIFGYRVKKKEIVIVFD